ncbi:MAG TPA: glycosyltransferase [Steroidobacteraceae bacterium]|jgi:cellulose synthase/poly-beta-1,6-N-acetylglucosamine synthase-like glycosyltransferase|nr:glycosyltransferase [Steroidobacteraceae bacterium]
MVITFWLALFLGLYPFVLYPALARAVAWLRRRAVCKASDCPGVTVVIAAFNEAACIERTVRNKLAQHYPADRLEVIVVSDASEDGTDQILERLAAAEPRLRWWRQEPRAGKSAALNGAIRQAHGDIVVFADANSVYAADAVSYLVSNFGDREVGYVTGKMVYGNPGGGAIGDGCSAYMRFENWLRQQETAIGSVVGVDGGVDAIRRELFQELRADQLPDFVTPLRVVAQGYRAVFEPAALLQEDALEDQGAEFRMRVRVTLRALWALRDCRTLLSPVGNPLFAWQLWSHKVLRYLAFIPLTVALALSILLAGKVLYLSIAAAGLAVLVCAALGLLFPAAGAGVRIIRLAQYFVLLNAASGIATFRFLRGERITVWKPRTG